MITTKKTLKRILSILTVAVILLSTLPIGASAVVLSTKVDIIFPSVSEPSSWSEAQIEAATELYYLVNNASDHTCSLSIDANGRRFLELHDSEFYYESSNLNNLGSFRNDSLYDFRISYGYYNGEVIDSFIVPAKSVVSLDCFGSNLIHFDFSPSKTLYFAIDTSYAPVLSDNVDTQYSFDIDIGTASNPGASANGPFSIGRTLNSGVSMTFELASESTVAVDASNGIYGKTANNAIVFTTPTATSELGDYPLDLVPYYSKGAYVFFTAPVTGTYTFDFELEKIGVSSATNVTYSMFYKRNGVAPKVVITHTKIDVNSPTVDRSCAVYMYAGDFVWLEVNNDNPNDTVPSNVALKSLIATYNSDTDLPDSIVLYNNSYSIIYGEFPDGSVKELTRIYAPDQTIGWYTYTKQSLFESGELELSVDGYTLDTTTVPATFTISDTSVRTYTLKYISTSSPEPDLDYNTSYSIINALFPDGSVKEITRIYPPEETVGSYDYSLYSLSEAGEIPSSLDGYILDVSTTPSVFTISDTEVLVYTLNYIPYESSEPDYNEGIHRFYAILPSGSAVFLGEIRPPDDHVGAYTYTYFDASLNFSFSDEQLAALEGFELNSDLFSVMEFITMSTDEFREINIPFRLIAESSRNIHFELYDGITGILVYAETISVPLSYTNYHSPIYMSFDTFPYLVNIDTSLDASVVQTFKCYVVDISDIRDEAYSTGYKSGLAFGQSELDSRLAVARKEGFDEGLKEGLSQNALTSKQQEELRKEYNVFTGFFDGLFTGLIDFYSTVTRGIAFGGVSLETVISTVAVISILCFVVKVIK